MALVQLIAFAGHAVQLVAPAALYVRSAQGVHSDAPAALNVFAGHFVATLSAHLEPAGHCVQTLSVDFALYQPGLHKKPGLPPGHVALAGQASQAV